jgi:hypothetical protein
MNRRALAAGLLTVGALALPACAAGKPTVSHSGQSPHAAATASPPTAGAVPNSVRVGALTIEFDMPLPADPVQAAIMEDFRRAQVLWNKSQSAHRVLAAAKGYLTGKALSDLKRSIRFIKSRDDIPVGIDRLFKTRITIATDAIAAVSTCDDASKFFQKNLRTGRFDRQAMPTAKTDHIFERWLMVRRSGHWAISNVSATVLPQAPARQCQP